MNKNKLKEERLRQIIKEELDLFGYDTSAYDAAQEKKAKRSLAAKKGAETRKKNKDAEKAKANKKLDKDMITAFSQDLFNDNPSDEERKAAKKRVFDYGKEIKKSKKK